MQIFYELILEDEFLFFNRFDCIIFEEQKWLF